MDDKHNLQEQISKLADYVNTLQSVPTLLVIEDNQDDLYDFNRNLIEVGREFKVVSVSSGKTGIEELEHHRFDLIFLDLRMPEMDGIEVMKAMKEMRVKAPIVIMSGLANGPMVNEAIQNGAWLHLRKPVQVEQLKQMLSRVKI